MSNTVKITRYILLLSLGLTYVSINKKKSVLLQTTLEQLQAVTRTICHRIHYDLFHFKTQ